MKIFLSSVISGYERLRDAAAEAIKTLGHDVLRAEDFAASPSAPQVVCLQGIRDADAVVLLLGARYGYVAPSGFSATHEEYREAKDRCPVFVFVENSASMDPKQQQLFDEVRSWDAGHYIAQFSNEKELQTSVIKALHKFELSTAVGRVDQNELLSRAEKLIPHSNAISHGLLCLSVVGGPQQSVLRPAQLEDQTLADAIEQEALFGSSPIFERSSGTNTRLKGNTLLIEQERSAILIDELGALGITLPARIAPKNDPFAGLVLIEEAVRERLETSLRFAGLVLDKIDPVRRLTDIAIVAGLSGAGYMGWQTREEHARSRGSFTAGQAGDLVVVHLQPALRKRASLTHDSSRIAEDLAVLLRRKVKG